MRALHVAHDALARVGVDRFESQRLVGEVSELVVELVVIGGGLSSLMSSAYARSRALARVSRSSY